MVAAAATSGDVSRFDLVTAGHHFLLDVVPFRHPESLDTLKAFVAFCTRSALPIADVDAVLLRCLMVLNDHCDNRLPTLVDRYLSDSVYLADSVRKFSQCVEDVLRYRGIGDRRVQVAISIMLERYADPTLSPSLIADAVGVSLTTLGVAFRRQTGSMLSEYLKDLRLEQSATLLIETTKSINEVWASVGYNHPSNFDHDFKRRFGRTPREYRARAIRSDVRRPAGFAAHPLLAAGRKPISGDDCRVLIVDDDDGTRETIGAHLRLEGYSVFFAQTGELAISETIRTSPSAILLDYRLDDMDGIACLRAIRQLPGGHRPGVTLFTADWEVFDIADKVRALDAVITSKLCDLNQIQRVVAYLSLFESRP